MKQPGLTDIHPAAVIGDRTVIDSFVKVEADVIIGTDCVIQSHAFICDKVRIGNDVFIGHGVMFCNDKRPFRYNSRRLIEPVTVRDNAAIGSGAVILPGVTIGSGALVGAGAVVTRDVPPGVVVAGNPAAILEAGGDEP